MEYSSRFWRAIAGSIDLRQEESVGKFLVLVEMHTKLIFQP